jgi:hypothetical protein
MNSSTTKKGIGKASKKGYLVNTLTPNFKFTDHSGCVKTVPNSLLI